ncbi:MAG: ribosome maturation factor RimM [Coprobacillus sp.]|nr:ribosome maturation factor RimM [Coprobacillus sp.]
MTLVLLGKITKLRGVHGEFKIYSSTYFSRARYKKGKTIYLSNDEGKTTLPLTVKSHHQDGKFDYVTSEEIDSANEAEKYINYSVYAEKDDIQLDEDTYYFSDLEGCKVIDEDNKELGTVLSVEEFPAQITLRVIKSNKKTFFVPFVEEYILNVDIESKTIQIHVVEGMME